MTGFTPYFVNKAVDHLFGGVSWTPPTTIYVQLHTGNPGSAGTANVAGTNTRKSASWSTASNGQISLTADLTWTSTAKESISHISYWDAATSGHCLATDELDQAKNLFVGDTFDLPSATLQIVPEA